MPSLDLNFNSSLKENHFLFCLTFETGGGLACFPYSIIAIDANIL